MRNFILKYAKSETVKYLFFGVLTTVVNYVSFIIFLKIMGYDKVLIVNTISFVLSVLFAFFTNKIWVFKSKNWKFLQLCKEGGIFISARILSYLFEQLGLFISSDILRLEKIYIFGLSGILIAKVVLSFTVVLINWVVSKYLVFKERK